MVFLLLTFHALFKNKQFGLEMHGVMTQKRLIFGADSSLVPKNEQQLLIFEIIIINM